MQAGYHGWMPCAAEPSRQVGVGGALGDHKHGGQTGRAVRVRVKVVFSSLGSLSNNVHSQDQCSSE